GGVVPVVVQAPLCGTLSFSVMLPARPVIDRLPSTFALFVSVIARSFSATSVTGTPVNVQTLPCVIASSSVIATEVGVPFAVLIVMLSSTLPKLERACACVRASIVTDEVYEFD